MPYYFTTAHPWMGYKVYQVLQVSFVSVQKIENTHTFWTSNTALFSLPCIHSHAWFFHSAQPVITLLPILHSRQFAKYLQKVLRIQKESAQTGSASVSSMFRNRRLGTSSTRYKMGSMCIGMIDG